MIALDLAQFSVADFSTIVNNRLKNDETWMRRYRNPSWRTTEKPRHTRTVRTLSWADADTDLLQRKPEPRAVRHQRLPAVAWQPGILRPKNKATWANAKPKNGSGGRKTDGYRRTSKTSTNTSAPKWTNWWRATVSNMRCLAQPGSMCAQEFRTVVSI